MFTYTKFEAICIALRIHKKKLQAVSRRQQEHRQQERRPQGCICLRAYIFSPHTINTQTPAGRPAGKKIKKCIHYIYTKYLFFMSKKCIHYICTLNHTSSRQQPFQRLHHYSPTPQTCRQQAEIWQITTNHCCSPTKTHTHILQAAELSIKRSKAKPLARQKGTHSPSRRHMHIFSPTFPASFKTADREDTSNRRRKKREKRV